jgi:hypothetical protein
MDLSWSEVTMVILIQIVIGAIIIGGYFLYEHISWNRYKRQRWQQIESAWKLQDTIHKSHLENKK